MKNDSSLHRHLDEAGETYLQHLLFTFKAAGILIASGVVLVIHGLLPFLLTHVASGMIDNLYAELKARKAACEARRKSTLQ